MFSKLFVSIATFSALATVCAQSSSAPAAALPTSPAGLTPCILNCTTTSATAAGCSSITDFACLCTSQTFQTAATQCLTTECTPADLQTALGLQKVECANVSPNSTATGTSASNSTATGAASGNSTATGAGTGATTPATGAGSPTAAPSPTVPAANPGSSSSSGSSGSSNTTAPPAGTTSSAAGVAQPFALSFTHIAGLAGAIAGVLSGCGLLL